MAVIANGNRATRGSRVATTVVVLALGLSSAGRAQSSQITIFPGRVSTSRSPNHRYILVNKNSDRWETPHRLYLINRQSGKQILLLRYPRWVATLWSPDSNALAVSDHFASNQSDCYVFALRSKIKRFDIWALLRKEFPDDRTLFFNYHVYLDAIRWTSPDRLRVEAHGHGSHNPKGFRVFFEYRTGGRISRVGPR